MKFSNRLQEVKRVHWHMVRKLIDAKEAQGVKTISLASGNPDLPTPPAIVEAACQALRDPTCHRYPFSFQTRYCEAVASWYRDRFDVELNPATEVRPLAGSQEGIGNLALTVCAHGGVYLGGGIVPGLAEFARSSPLRRRFEERVELNAEFVEDLFDLGPREAVDDPHLHRVGGNQFRYRGAVLRRTARRSGNRIGEPRSALRSQHRWFACHLPTFRLDVFAAGVGWY